jgi:hypothetical protein
MLNKISALGSGGSDPAPDWIDHGAAVQAQALHDLRALPPPPTDVPKLREIYAKDDAVLASLARWSKALRAGDDRAAKRALTRLNTDGDASDAASLAFGLTECAKT